MFMPLYEFLIDPLGLPIHWLWEYIILLIIDKIAYRTAFSAVGDLYDAGMDGKGLGSFFHCVIRTFCFAVMWAITYVVIWACKWLFANWILIVSILGGIVLLVGIIAFIIKMKNKEKEVSPNEQIETK